MAESVPIPKDLLAEFKRGSQYSQSSSSESGLVPSNLALQSGEKGLEWIIKYANRQAQKNGMPGVEDMEPAELAELGRICLVQLKQESLLEKSPLAMMAVILAGTAFNNWIAFNENQKKLGSAGEQPNKGEKEGE